MIAQEKLNQYFGDFIYFHVGDKEFNKEMNHWFDHKIPDRHSLVPEHRPDSDVGIKEPYKKVWTIFGRKWNKNDELEYYRNSNKLLIDPNYTEDFTLDILEFNEYSNLECTSTIGAYNIKIKEMENLLMRTYGVFY